MTIIHSSLQRSKWALNPITPNIRIWINLGDFIFITENNLRWRFIFIDHTVELERVTSQMQFDHSFCLWVFQAYLSCAWTVRPPIHNGLILSLVPVQAIYMDSHLSGHEIRPKKKKKRKWVWDRRIRSSMHPHGISCTSSAMIDGAARKGPNCKSNEEEYLACGTQKCLATLSHFWIFINERME